MQNERQLLDKIISSAFIGIIEEHPLYYSILKRIPKFFRSDLKCNCALGIDQSTGFLSILLNDRMLSNIKVDQMKIMLEHLLMHILLPHHNQNRIEQGHRFHLACDLLINQTISEIRNSPKLYSKKTSAFGKLLKPSDLSGLHGFESVSFEDSSAFEIWQIINDENHVKDIDSFDTIDETEFSIQNFISVNKWKVLKPGNEKLLQTQVKRSVIEAVSEMARMGKGPGVLPGFMSKRINQILMDSQVDYSSLIMKFATRAISNERRRSWTRVHRKYPNQIRGRIKKEDEVPRLLVVMDTSGSMWNDSLLIKVMTEIKKIHKICPDLWVVGGDVAEQFRFCIQSNEFNPSKHELSGGGGTDLQFGFEAARTLNVDGIIVLTDGFIPEFNSHNIATAFVIVPGGTAVPGYENIFLT